MAATATIARLPNKACAVERDRPRPVLIRATPAMASGASSSKARTSTNVASVMTGGTLESLVALSLRFHVPRTATTRPALQRPVRRTQMRPVPPHSRQEQHQRGNREKETGWHHQQSGEFHCRSFFESVRSGPQTLEGMDFLPPGPGSWVRTARRFLSR